MGAHKAAGAALWKTCRRTMCLDSMGESMSAPDWNLYKELQRKLSASEVDRQALATEKAGLEANYAIAREAAAIAGDIARELGAVTADRDRLRAALGEAIDDIDDWASYASDYFRDKHDLAGTLAKHRAALSPDNTKGEQT
jgi:hypothetical protein